MSLTRTPRLFSRQPTEPAPIFDQSALALRGVTRAYTGRRVLGPLSLEVEPGGVVPGRGRKRDR